MTEQNAKQLYEHFLKTGQVKQANDILKAYPHFAKKVEEYKEDEKTKSKEKK